MREHLIASLIGHFSAFDHGLLSMVLANWRIILSLNVSFDEYLSNLLENHKIVNIGSTHEFKLCQRLICV